VKNLFNHKMSLIVLAYAVAVAAAGYFVFWPLISGLSHTADTIQENLLDQQFNKIRLQNLPGMENDWAEYRANKNSLNVILSPSSEVGFIEEVESIASSTKNTINLQIGDPSDPTQIAKVKRANAGNKANAPKSILDGLTDNNYFPVQINLTGDYPGLVGFIHALENMQFYVNIVSIAVNKNQVPVDSSGTDPGDIFSGQSGANGNGPQKEVLNTIINAVVYTQK
jgi:Tfp pilus assembly protein PilO